MGSVLTVVLLAILAGLVSYGLGLICVGVLDHLATRRRYEERSREP